MYPKAAPVEKPYVLNAWGNAIVYVVEAGACEQALELYREALRLKPDYLVAQYNVMQMLTNLGREEVDPGSAPDMAARALAAGMLAHARGDEQEAAREMEAMQKQYAVSSVRQSSAALLCFAAPIYESAGFPAKADAIFASVGTLTFLDCTRFKADILDARGDWGDVLSKMGRRAEAHQKYKDALRYAPEWTELKSASTST